MILGSSDIGRFHTDIKLQHYYLEAILGQYHSVGTNVETHGGVF